MELSPAYRRLLEAQARVAEIDALERSDDEDGPDDEAGDRAFGGADAAAHAATLDDNHQLLIAPVGDRLHVIYSGPGTHPRDSEAYALVLETLADPVVSDALHALTFTGPDQGANGTREWCFTPLLESGVRFPHLRNLIVAPGDNAAHNAVCIVREGEILDEAGDIARFAALAPGLEELVLPESPNADFFQVPLPALRRLRIGAAHDTRGFVGHLARSRNLADLHHLDFSDAIGPFMRIDEDGNAADDYPPTPFADYEALFDSPLMRTMWGMVLRNTQLTEAQYRQLQARKPGFQLQVTHDFPASYVSHWRPRGFAWRHLLVTG